MEILSRLNTLDLAIVAVLVFGFLSGWIQGLLRQLMGLAAFYVALVLGAQYHRLVAGWLMSLAPGSIPVAADSLAFLAIFGLTTALFSFVGHHVYANTKLPLLTMMDGVGGGVFGLLTACLQVVIGLTVLKFLLGSNWFEWESTRQAMVAVSRASSVGPIFQASAPALIDLLRPWLPAGMPALFAF